MRCIAVILVCAFIATIGCASESFQALFDRANRHFESGDMDAARAVYETMIRQGCRDSAVYYNLGNCYLHEGDIGHSIKNYLFAEQISPRDPDIQANLSLARSLVVQKVEAPVPNWFVGMIVRLQKSVTLQEMSIGLILFYLMMLVFGLLGYFSSSRRLKRRFIRFSVLSGVVMLIGVLGLSMRIYEREYQEWAVATGSEVPARTGPGDHFTEVYRQQPGYEMRVIRHQSGWAEVRLANGFTGWIPEQSIELL